MEKHIRFDWAIKRLLRQKSNFEILEGFLSELLGYDVFIKKILESEGNKETKEDKFNRVDILVEDKKGDLMLIEVQNEREHDYFHRMNYEQAKLITEYISSGESYDSIKRVISINIVYFKLGKGKDYIYEGRTEFRGKHSGEILQLSKKQKEMYKYSSVSDIFSNYYIIEIKNFDDNATSTLDEWIYFLKNNEIKESFRAKGIQSAKEKLRVDNLEGIEKIEYQQYIKEQRIRMGELNTLLYDERKKMEKAVRQTQEALKQLEQETKRKEEAIIEKRKAIDEEQKAMNEKQKAISEKQKAVSEKQKAISEKEEAKNKIIELARLLKSLNVSTKEIVEKTGLPEQEINKKL